MTAEPNQAAAPATWERVSRHRPCPICGRPDYCEILSDGSAAHCMRTPSPQPVTFRQGGFIHYIGNRRTSLTGLAAIGAAPGPQVEKLDPVIADRMNRRLMELLPDLIPTHQPLITPIPPAQVRSFNRAISERTATAIAMEFGSELAARYPAIIQSGYNHDEDRPIYRMACNNNGVFIPFTNERTGHVLGFQLKAEKAFKSSRYTWVSHDGLTGTPYGVIYRPGATRVIITEGRRKAEAGSHNHSFSFCHFLYLAGVSSFNRASLLSELAELAPTQITIAFDMDKYHNKAVHDAELKLIRLLQKELPEAELTTLEWKGAGKGLDDAIQAGHTDFKFQPIASPKRKQFNDKLLAELHAAVFGQPRPLYTLQEARSRHLQLARKIVYGDPAAPRQAAITSITGTGKSTAFDQALTEHATDPKATRQILLLAPNKANIQERIAINPALKAAVNQGYVAIQQGRNQIDLNDPGQPRTPFDCAEPSAATLGQARHIPARTICGKCIFGSAENWTEAGNTGPRTFKCDEIGYIASQKTSRAARTVIATKETFLNESDQLNRFDAVIVDEGLMTHLTERIEIGTAEINTWLNSISSRTLPITPTWNQLIKTLNHALTSIMPAMYAEIPNRAQPLYPAMKPLEEAAKELALSLDFILTGMADPEGNETYSFEYPYRLRGDSADRIPFRAGMDLLHALREGDSTVSASRNKDGSFSLIVTRKRTKLIDMLKSRQLAVLDATLPPSLKKVFPDMQEVSFAVHQHLNTTQITNGLYTSRDLENDRTRADVEKAIAKFCAALGEGKVLVIMPKKYEDSGPKKIKLPSNGISGHWGKDERATNSFSDYAGLILIGHPLRPVDLIKAEVDAFRGYTTRTGSSAAPDQEPDQAPEALRIYNYLNPDTGLAAGRYCKADPDPDYQQAIEGDYSANIIQAIGRLRAALRPDTAAPAEIFIMCSEPVNSLKIDRLTTASKVEWQDVSFPQVYIMEPEHLPILHGQPANYPLEATDQGPAAPADRPEEPTNISSQLIALLHPATYQNFTPLPNPAPDRAEAAAPTPLPAVTAANPPLATAAPATANPWTTSTAGIYAGMIAKATSRQHLEGILRRVSLNITHRPDYRRLQELAEARPGQSN